MNHHRDSLAPAWVGPIENEICVARRRRRWGSHGSTDPAYIIYADADAEALRHRHGRDRRQNRRQERASGVAQSSDPHNHHAIFCLVCLKSALQSPGMVRRHLANRRRGVQSNGR